MDKKLDLQIIISENGSEIEKLQAVQGVGGLKGFGHSEKVACYPHLWHLEEKPYIKILSNNDEEMIISVRH